MLCFRIVSVRRRLIKKKKLSSSLMLATLLPLRGLSEWMPVMARLGGSSAAGGRPRFSITERRPPASPISFSLLPASLSFFACRVGSLLLAIRGVAVGRLLLLLAVVGLLFLVVGAVVLLLALHDYAEGDAQDVEEPEEVQRLEGDEQS